MKNTLRKLTSAQARFIEQSKENIDATTVFCTAFECAQSHLSLTEHTHLIRLQSINGLTCGEMLYLHSACSNIVAHTANCMHKEIVDHIVEKKSKFSLMIDESMYAAMSSH